MKNYAFIERLDEGSGCGCHCYGNNPDNPMPQDLLDMKIGDLLDKVLSFDSDGDAEYESLTSILDALSSKILPGSHEGDSHVSANSNDTVEADDDQNSSRKPGDSTQAPTPSWSQEEGGKESGGEENMDNFEF